MNNRILTIIFGTLAVMFQELNNLILSGCEAEPEPAPDNAREAAAILSSAPDHPLGPTILPAGGAVMAPPSGLPGAATAPPTVDPNVRVDSEGLPWDERIHSSGKTFYKSKAANGAPKGAWKLKKGVAAVDVAQIKTELAGGAAAGTAAPTVTPSTPPGETTEQCADIYTWASLVEKATAKGVTPEAMAAACQKYNVPGIIELQDQALLIPAVGKELGL